MSLLFSPIKIGKVNLKNRIMMSPMCMYSCFNKDGKVTDFHITHYLSRAHGQTGLIMVEAAAVSPEGRISDLDLGLWDNSQIEGFKKLTDLIHETGSKIGIQLAHAGRKAKDEKNPIAPSPLAFDKNFPIPHEMNANEIKKTINDFKLAAERAKKAGFDIIEIHGAHGYLISSFLSPLTNKRKDEYGGDIFSRYTFLKKIINAVQKPFKEALFIRLSTNDYDEKGNKPEDFIEIIKEMKNQGVNLIDCSSGSLIPYKIPVYPGYQVQYSDLIKNKANIKTGAVGLITSPHHAEEILKNNRADLIILGRTLLRNPYWPIMASHKLKSPIEAPEQYKRGWLSY